MSTYLLTKIFVFRLINLQNLSRTSNKEEKKLRNKNVKMPMQDQSSENLMERKSSSSSKSASDDDDNREELLPSEDEDVNADTEMPPPVSTSKVVHAYINVFVDLI
jgi:hypothetical protein